MENRFITILYKSVHFCAKIGSQKRQNLNLYFSIFTKHLICRRYFNAHR